MIVITLQNGEGWKSTMSKKDLYEFGRGWWVLNYDRARREDHVLFAAEGIVRWALEIDRIEHRDEDDRYAFVGRMLEKGDQVFDTYVGKPSPIDPTRNPIRYLSPLGKTCACGCGTPTEREFVPGHDQRAIHDRISREFRSVSDFLKWFDSQFPAKA